MGLSVREFAAYFDHTLLRANATALEISKLCDEAKEFSFRGVCVNAHNLPQVVKALAGFHEILPVAVVGFPLGAVPTRLKAIETRYCVEHGAREIDMVINLGAYLSGEQSLVREDFVSVVEAARQIPVKVIIETAWLSDRQIHEVSQWCQDAGAAFVKTSTGYGPRGASVHDVEIIQKALRERPDAKALQIKASGGIRTLASALELIRAGAHRIGSSLTVDMVKEFAATTLQT